jgi:hypothetical protein
VRAGPVQGSAVATKFEDYTVFTHIGVKPSVRTGRDQNHIHQTQPKTQPHLAIIIQEMQTHPFPFLQISLYARRGRGAGSEQLQGPVSPRPAHQPSLWSASTQPAAL